MEENQSLKPISPRYGHHPQQKLFPVAEVELNGIQMGVLSDGTPYLTLRGLALMCGIDMAALSRLCSDWTVEQTRPRGTKIRELLLSQGHAADSLYIITPTKGVDTYAFTDAVCMAILEYYAFEAPSIRTTALNNFRILARYTFRRFIYTSCGYDPDKLIPDPWRDFQARMARNNQVPSGYFSVFREMADIVVDMILNGCPIDEHTIPDISVGISWSKHWAAKGLEITYGLRRSYPHVYPEWFPQASNGPVEAYIYPALALGEFRIWMDEVYIPEKFPKYVQGKARKGVFPLSTVELLLEAVTKPSLTA